MGLKIILAKKRKDDLTGVLAIQNIVNGLKTQKRIRINIKQEYFETYFDKDNNIFLKNSDIDYKTLNKEINKEINLFLNRKVVEVIEDESDDNISFRSFLIKEISLILVPATKTKYLELLRLIDLYLIKTKKKDLLFKEINLDYINLFVVWLKNRELANSSIVDYISLFRRVVNTAINSFVYAYKIYPFTGYKPLKKNTKHKEPLTDENIDKLVSLKSDGSSKSDKLIYIKDMFLFQFFTNGMRMSDLFFVRWGDFKPKKLVYQMMKTDKIMEVFLNINICHILNAVLNNDNLYEEVIRNTKEEVPRNCFHFLYQDGLIHKVNIKECNDILDRLGVIKENVTNEVKGGDISRYECYNNYWYPDITRERNEVIKEVIDLRNYIEDKIENTYIFRTYKLIREKDKSEFVFEGFIKDNQRGIFKKYDKTKELTDNQYLRYKNLQGLYNYSLKRIEDIYKFDVHISSHIARHSFINSLLKSGIADLWDIKNLMGHGELRTSEKYISEHFQGKEKQYEINKNISRIYQMRKIE
jgi:integrase